MRKTAFETWRLMLALMLAFWLPAGSVRAADEPAPDRMTATVVEFSVRGELNEQAGAIIADLMMSAIANTGRFILKDRLPLTAAATIAKAQELGSTGLLDPGTAAELGRRYGVDAVVTGGVYKLGDLITVTARLIDTKTASLLRSGQIQGKDIDTIQIKVNELAAMITAPLEPPRTFALTVRTEPAEASVRLLNSATPYQPGVRLPPGDYEIEVTQPGYVAHREIVRIGDSDATLAIVLEKARYGLMVRPEPADAQIRLLESSVAYRPGVPLAPGDYEVEVTREGYVSRRFPVRIVDTQVTVPVTLEKAPPPAQRYRLTVQVEPPQATVRLLNTRTPYRPGVSLSPGRYTVEVTQSGYEPTQVAVPIIDSDVTVPVTLVKRSEPERPTLYRLTVRADPTDARVRLLGTKAAYRPGVSLPPGGYTVEVSRKGYETKRLTARITDSDVTVPVTLVKQPEPTQYRLTVRTDPTDARVRLRGIGTVYRPGVPLPPGSYAVEVSRPGYETQQVTARIVDGDVTVPVTLVKQPEPTQYRLTVNPSPPNARIRLLNSRVVYRSGVALPPGSYTVEVTGNGYAPKRVTVRITDGDVTLPVELEKTASVPPTVPTPSRAGEWRIGAVRVDSSLSGVDRAEVSRLLNGYVGRTVTRDTLLDGALRVHQATGITLSFVVRSGAGGVSELYARAARQTRRSYESGISIMTRSQLERSGFGVSVE